MKNRLWVWLGILLLIPGLMVMTSCSKKAVKSDASATEISDKAPGGKRTSDDDLAKQQRALDEERLKQERERLANEQAYRERSERERFVNEDIYFDYDSAVLTSEAQEILKRKAEFLRKNNLSIIIEGHCDERGTNEYNMALGERRAESAKAFLVNLGISASRITTISYGEERPVDPGHNESAWQKNRRAHFEFK